VSVYVLLGLALLVTLLIGGLLGRVWKVHEERAIEKKWQERERLLDRRKGVASRHEVLRRRTLRRRSTHARPSSRRRKSGR
jgi:hypothetical protein